MNNFTGKKLKVTLNTARDTILNTIISSAYLGFPSTTIYIEGASGIGKSAIVKKIIKMLNDISSSNEVDNVTWELLDKRLAGFSASDLQGIPYPAQSAKSKFFKWLKDDGLPGIGEHSDWGILFLDELNQVSDESVQSLTYQLLLDRKINDYTVPEGWFIVCAGNREEDGGVYERIKAPVRNRMMILEVEFDKEEWFQWAEEVKIHPAIISFLRLKDSLGVDVFQTYDADKEARGDIECENYIFVTPRTWQLVSDRLYASEKLSKTKSNISKMLTGKNVIEALICGYLGESLGKEFTLHYKRTSKVPLEDIFNSEWLNGNPVKKSLTKQLSVGDDTYIMTNVKYMTDHKKLAKVIIYLMYSTKNVNTIKVLLNELTADEKNKYIVEYLTETNSTSILSYYNKIAKDNNVVNL